MLYLKLHELACCNREGGTNVALNLKKKKLQGHLSIDATGTPHDYCCTVQNLATAVHTTRMRPSLWCFHYYFCLKLKQSKNKSYRNLGPQNRSNEASSKGRRRRQLNYYFNRQTVQSYCRQQCSPRLARTFSNAPPHTRSPVRLCCCCASLPSLASCWRRLQYLLEKAL